MFYSVTDIISKPNTSNFISTKHMYCICCVCSLRNCDITNMVYHNLYRKPRNQRLKNFKIIISDTGALHELCAIIHKLFIFFKLDLASAFNYQDYFKPTKQSMIGGFSCNFIDFAGFYHIHNSVKILNNFKRLLQGY